MLSKQLDNCIARFLAAHEQHAIKITFTSQESQERGDLPVEIELECHNGQDWMGFSGTCTPDLVGSFLGDLLDDADRDCPNMKNRKTA